MTRNGVCVISWGKARNKLGPIFWSCRKDFNGRVVGQEKGQMRVALWPSDISSPLDDFGRTGYITLKAYQWKARDLHSLELLWRWINMPSNQKIISERPRYKSRKLQTASMQSPYYRLLLSIQCLSFNLNFPITCRPAVQFTPPQNRCQLGWGARPTSCLTRESEQFDRGVDGEHEAITGGSVHLDVTWKTSLVPRQYVLLYLVVFHHVIGWICGEKNEGGSVLKFVWQEVWCMGFAAPQKFGHDTGI